MVVALRQRLSVSPSEGGAFGRTLPEAWPGLRAVSWVDWGLRGQAGSRDQLGGAEPPRPAVGLGVLATLDVKCHGKTVARRCENTCAALLHVAPSRAAGCVRSTDCAGRCL